MGGNTKPAASDRGGRGRAGRRPRPALRSGRSRSRATRRAPPLRGAECGARGGCPRPQRTPRQRLRRTWPPRAQSPRAAGGPGAPGAPRFPTTAGGTKPTAVLRPPARCHPKEGPQGPAPGRLLRPQPRWQQAGRGTGTAGGTARPPLARGGRGRRLVGRRGRSQ